MGRPALWIDLNCPKCGKQFRAKPHKVRAGRTYCSKSCWQIGGSKPWANGNKWAWRDNPGEAAKMWRTKQKYPELRSGQCNRCDNPAELLHHKDEDRLNLAPDNIEPLCRSCHIKHHHEKLTAGRIVDNLHPGSGWIIAKALK